MLTFSYVCVCFSVSEPLFLNNFVAYDKINFCSLKQVQFLV